MGIRSSTLSILFVICGAGLGFGQEAAWHRGFWFGGGLGAGAGRLECGVCEGEGMRGSAGHVRAGMTVNQRLLLGGEAALWQRSADEGKRRILAFTAGLWWYPKPADGFFLRAGAGLSRWRAWESGDGEGEAVISNSLVLVAGAGYDVRLNPALSIVPFVNAFGSGSGALWVEDWDDVSYQRRKLSSGAHALLLQVGVGLTRH